MKTGKAFKVWQVIYPVGIYYVVSSLAYFFLEMIMGNDVKTYMLRQLVCSAVTIPFIYSFYRQDREIEKVVYGEKEKKKLAEVLKEILFIAASTATLAIAVNNFLAMTPLIELSTGFKEANTAFFAGEILFELTGSCLVIPFAEELLFRGVVYKRLRILFGITPAIILSAVLFGILHMNLVQFLYAAILGMFLAFLVEKTGKLSSAVLGHMTANLVAVVRTETGWLDFSYEPDAAGIGFTVGAAAIAGGMIFCWYKKFKFGDAA